jgi:hypothetical protein
MKHLFRCVAVLGALALALVAAGCGSDDDKAASTDSGGVTTTAASTSSDGTASDATSSDGGDQTAAPMADTDFCKLALEMSNQDDIPSPAQLKRYKELAPDQIADEVGPAADKLLAADGDTVKFFATFAEDDVEHAIADTNAFEDEQCGTHHAEEDTPLPKGATKAVEDDATRVDVTAVDYKFELPEELKAGRTSFVLTNDGNEAHFLLIGKLKDGVTLDQAMQAQDDSSFTAMWESGMAAPDGQDEEAITFDLEPGNYGAMCFIPAADGTPHAMKGMAIPFTVS